MLPDCWNGYFSHLDTANDKLRYDCRVIAAFLDDEYQRVRTRYRRGVRIHRSVVLRMDIVPVVRIGLARPATQ